MGLSGCVLCRTSGTYHKQERGLILPAGEARLGFDCCFVRYWLLGPLDHETRICDRIDPIRQCARETGHLKWSRVFFFLHCGRTISKAPPLCKRGSVVVTVNHQTCCVACPVSFPTQPRSDVTRVKDREREGATRFQEAIGTMHGAGQIRPIHQGKRGQYEVKRSIRQNRALGVGCDVILYTERFFLFRLPGMSDEAFRQVDPGHSCTGLREAARVSAFSTTEVDDPKAGYISNEPLESRLGEQVPVTVETRANIRCPPIRISVPVGGDVAIGHTLFGHRFHSSEFPRWREPEGKILLSQRASNHSASIAD